MIRLMNADEIECRVGTIGERGLSLLLYKDARVDQRILDETFTEFGWRRTHQEIGGKLFCTVDVWDAEKQQWISKQDIGTESTAEKEKGQASDSFKRACFNWGLAENCIQPRLSGFRLKGWKSVMMASVMPQENVLAWNLLLMMRT